MRYLVTNARNQAVTVDLRQSGLAWGWDDTRIISESQKSNRVNNNATEWQVQVPANGEATVTATFETRY